MTRILTARAEIGPAHDIVHVWNRGGKAGELVVTSGDGALVAAHLARISEPPTSIGDARARFLALVHSFHTLTDAPGVTADDIDLRLLDRWASGDPNAHNATRGPFPGDGAKAAACFVLNLWDTRTKWYSGPFNVFHALVVWDDSQREAWIRWASAPWRP